MSLYAFMKDTQNGRASSCTGECAEKWPPLLTQAVPVAGEGVDATLLGTITRDDGSLQVTYNGWPLYLYKTDVMAGDYYGQGLDDFGGLWFLVSPAGEAIQE
jgi:predicted lipoprotein with Yx(FWY)xxD motif